MYKVFLADDEAAMREGVRNNVEWDGSDFTLAGEAPDGELALSLMQEIMPDILITDVRMPFMDGLELAKIVKKTMPWIKIVILSGHDEFEYAQRAISIGIEDYLLKPVTSAKLMETLKNVAQRVEAEKKSLKNVENLVNDARRVRADRLLSDLLYGNVTFEQAAPLAAELGVPIISGYYLAMLIELRARPDEGREAVDGALARITGALDDWGNVVYFIQGLDRVVCLLMSDGPASLAEEAYACARAVKYEAERNTAVPIAIAVGSIVSDAGEWSKSVADAKAAARNSRDAISGQKYDDIIMQAKNYIHDNFQLQGISLNTVAGEVNISPNHFSAIFRQATGETFISYLTKTRLERAKLLLKTTQMRTSEISYEVGYNDTHYFNYVFKKNTGLTPKEFRAV